MPRILYYEKRLLKFLSEAFAEREGFEPPVPLSTPVFKTGAFDHSAISPQGVGSDRYSLAICCDSLCRLAYLRVQRQQFLFNLQNFSPLFFEKHEKKNVRTRFVACVSDFSNSKYLISNALCAPILAKASGKAERQPLLFLLNIHLQGIRL